MKVSGGQRHMYAKRLRRFYPSEPVPNARESKNIRDAIQCVRGYDVFNRLADLIDRPTCHDLVSHGGMQSVGSVQWFECSECHCKVQTDKIGMALHFCPHCGAEVVANG